MAVGLLQAPPPGRVVVVVGTGSAGGVTVRLKVPCAPPYPSTTMKYVCPAVTVGVEARGAGQARGVGARIVVAPDLGPARERPAAQVGGSRAYFIAGRPATMRRYSSSAKARQVSMRTLPRAPSASDSLTAVSSSGASATTTASYLPVTR